MLHLLIDYLVTEINAYLSLRSPAMDRDRLVSGTLLDPDGKANPEVRDKIVLSIVNVQKDPVYHSVEIFEKRTDGKSELVKPEIKINIYILFVANLNDYGEAVKALSQIIEFFQQRNAFEYASIPSLSHRNGRVVFDLFSTTFEDQNHLWGALGAKYMPSVMYKAGIVDIRDAQIEAEIPPLEQSGIGESQL